MGKKRRTIQTITLSDLRDTFLQKTDEQGNYSNSILSPEKQRMLDGKRDPKKMEQIKLEIIEDLTPSNKQGIMNETVRSDLISKSSKTWIKNCKICSSPFYTMYMQWLTLDNKSYVECSRLANDVFGDEISEGSFSNHKLNHLLDPKIVRRAMIARDPDVQPKKVNLAMIQILQQEMIENPEINVKTGKLLLEHLKLADGMNPRAPMVDARSVSITQVNNNGIPVSKDTQEAIQRELSDGERAQLKLLQEKWKGRGTGAIRSKIQDPPKVIPDKANVIDVDVIEDHK
jgi:hypothetical protein